MNTRLLLLLTLAVACTDKEADDTSASTTDDSGVPETDDVCTEPEELTCTDELILDLSLHAEVSEGTVTETTEGEDFVSLIDATAGGYSKYSQNPWVYIKFTEAGAQKVEIDDESALESMDWDMSLRRYILRLNGGDSGPSCVGAAALLESTYEELTSVPDGMTYFEDDYYTDDCSFVNDSSGLEGSPQVALSYWWEYPGCVATTHVPFLVQLADGHIIKLTVETYYESNQQLCDDDGTVPADGGYITLRWRYLQ